MHGVSAAKNNVNLKDLFKRIALSATIFDALTHKMWKIMIFTLKTDSWQH